MTLEPGQELSCPFLMLPVLLPGSTLPASLSADTAEVPVLASAKDEPRVGSLCVLLLIDASRRTARVVARATVLRVSERAWQAVDVRVLREASDLPRRPAPELTHHDACVWRSFDVSSLAAALLASPALLAVLSAAEGVLTPTQLSWRASALLPLDEIERCALLNEPHTASRLKRLLRVVTTRGQLHCCECGAAWAAASSAFTPSLLEPGAGVFVNPHGFVHGVLAVRSVLPGSLGVLGPPSLEATWFPGFAWALAFCSRCRVHSGWQYTKEGEPSFFGLRTGSFVHKAAERVKMRTRRDDDRRERTR